MRKVIIEYAGNHDLSVWDFYSAMGGEGSMNHWLNIGLAKPDRIHLTAKGYNLKGEMLSTALLDGYAHYLKKQGSK
jgi:lysophospholipase L1-like esterase